MPLASLSKGAEGEIVRLEVNNIVTSIAPAELERRLIEMGLVEGAHITVMHEGFPRRDPIAVRVDDHTVALRRSEAAAVIVVPTNGEQ